MAVTSPATFDPGTSGWADAVAAAVNAGPTIINGGSNVPATSTGVKIQSGTFTGTFSAANNVTGTLTYPVAFSTTPVIVATVLLGVAADVVVSWTSVSSTAAGWRLETNNTNTTSTTQTVHWIAIGT